MQLSNNTRKSTPAGLPAHGHLPVWKSILLSLAAIGLFFGLLEAILAIAGVKPALQEVDPFVGFASNIPLFEAKTDSEGRQMMVTADNKPLFNRQEFARIKPPGVYRIFCLGGSTTYGRPYSDTTSFAGWLRELLPVLDPGLRWEVINAGGISYASYRVTELMKELAQYEPDLFIIYSGHNEFLEQRSYGRLRETPGAVRSIAAVLARTRTWTAMHLLLKRAGVLSPADSRPDGRNLLNAEVDTLLRRFGPDIYERDDTLRDQIVRHYRFSLQRMVNIADAVEAEVMFVTPASNLKDSTPFKSQHSDGLGPEDRTRVKNLLSRAMAAINRSEWRDALSNLDEAVRIDSRYAELHFRRGRVLFALGRQAEAKAAFEKARDEDICPLRALSSMRTTLGAVANETDRPLIDFIALLEQNLQKEEGHSIPGREVFLDHVHPTIEGNRMLAVRLAGEMMRLGILAPGRPLDDSVIAAVSDRIESRIDPKMHSRALANLAKVLSWAGKKEEAARLALQALDSDAADPAIVSDAAVIVAGHHALQGDTANELKYFRMALNAEPANPEVHFQFGLQMMKHRQPQLEVAAAHILFASVFWSESHRDMLHRLLGRIMAQRGRYAAAYENLLEAQSINPHSAETEALLVRIRNMLGARAQNLMPPKIALARYPSGNLRRIVQVKPNAVGSYIPNGLWTEWYEGGELKRVVDYSDGRPQGVDLKWQPDGSPLPAVGARSG
jgi:tetratricopeptide (TPR) repeat protein